MSNCSQNCNQGRSCDCAPASRGLPLLVIACGAVPLIVLALTGCKRISTDDRVEQLEHRLQTHEQAGCRGVRDPEPTAQRERAASMAAMRGGREA